MGNAEFGMLNAEWGGGAGRLLLSRVIAAVLVVLAVCGWASASPTSQPSDLPHTVWLEAETFAPLHGGNFSYQKPENTTKGSWSVAGPGVAAEWTQGGESEWMSIAARADEPGEVVAGREAVVPAAGKYALWVRYADYRGKKESFGVRVKQGDKTFSHVFGEKPVVDDLDQMNLLWDWSFAWDRAEVELQKGPVRVEVYTTGPTEARRQVDCLCLTTDADYHPYGREKPDAATWRALRAIRAAGPGDVEPLAAVVAGDNGAAKPATKPWAAEHKSWKIDDGPPTFLWNVGDPWLEELKKPADAKGRMRTLFHVDPPMLNDLLAALRDKEPQDVPVFGSALSAPAWHVRDYPSIFAPGSPFDRWLDANGQKKFAVLLNYGEPNWPANAKSPADKAKVRQAVEKRGGRFVGYIAGESLSYASPDGKVLDERLKAAKSRADVLAALRDGNTAATAKKLSEMYGAEVPAAEAWKQMIPCLSANNEAYAHATADWGCARVGHENSGNSPTLARRLAFLRGAARQFGCKVADYQSCNLGDASTIFDRQALFYPASSKYVLDNQYDIWAGSGLNWVLKDYLLFYLAGADAFYHEEGNDIYWKPGGNSAGDNWPVGLSPRGRVTDAVVRLAEKRPRGVQYTPVAFLLDEAHGWAQERFVPGAFGLDPTINPAVLTPGKHEASIRGWFDVAYYPAPETQNEPATAIRQTYVNGIFGDIFDVIVTAKGHADIAKTYPVLIAAGEVPLSEEWGKALEDYVHSGGTLVACEGSLSGPGAARLHTPAAAGDEAEAASIVWKPTGETVPSNVYRYRPLPANDPAAEGGAARVLATAPDGGAVAVASRRGRGSLITVSVPLGLGLDDRPVPVLAHLMRHLTQGLVPVKVAGDVEWTVSRLNEPKQGWLVGLLNNRGVNKPQHGVNPTDHREAQQVTLTTPFAVAGSAEWIAGGEVKWQTKGDKGASTAALTLPAGAVRLVAIYPAP